MDEKNTYSLVRMAVWTFGGTFDPSSRRAISAVNYSIFCRAFNSATFWSSNNGKKIRISATKLQKPSDRIRKYHNLSFNIFSSTVQNIQSKRQFRTMPFTSIAILRTLWISLLLFLNFKPQSHRVFITLDFLCKR